MWTPEGTKADKRGVCGSAQRNTGGPRDVFGHEKAADMVQEASKKRSKSEHPEKMKIELSLQPKLNPARQKTNKLRFRTGLSGMLIEMNQKLKFGAALRGQSRVAILPGALTVQ